LVTSAFFTAEAAVTGKTGGPPSLAARRSGMGDVSDGG